jgi:hypothetical protein
MLKLKIFFFVLCAGVVLGCSDKMEYLTPTIQKAYIKSEALSEIGITVTNAGSKQIIVKKIVGEAVRGSCIFDFESLERSIACRELYADPAAELTYAPFAWSSKIGKYTNKLPEWNLSKIKGFGLETGWLKRSDYWSTKGEFETEEEYRARVKKEKEKHNEAEMREKISHTYELAIFTVSDLTAGSEQYRRMFYDADGGGWRLNLNDIRTAEDIEVKTALETIVTKKRQVIRIENQKELAKTLRPVLQDRQIAQEKGWSANYKIIFIFRLLAVSDEYNTTSCADVGFGYGPCTEHLMIYNVEPLYVAVDMEQDELTTMYSSDEMKGDISGLLKDLIYFAYGTPDADEILASKLRGDESIVKLVNALDKKLL